MKATTTDYLLSFLVISFLISVSACTVAAGWRLSVDIFRDYHVLADALIFFIGYGVYSAVVLRVLLAIRPMRAGTYGENSVEFTYWKLLTVIHRLGQGALRPFTPVFLLPLVDSIFGARIGTDVAFGGEVNDPYLVTIGDGTTLGTHSIVTGSFTGGGTLTCSPIVIGRRVTVGPNAVISPGCVIGDDANIVTGSFVMPNTNILAGETWRGNPARKWVQTTFQNGRLGG